MIINKDRNQSAAITLQDVWKAKKRISQLLSRTPLYYSPVLSEQTNNHIYLKYEHLHESGAFKLRGAINSLLSLTTEQKSKGVATFSTGNHGLALALTAKKLGIPATICVSNRVPEAKLNRIRSLGASLEIYGKSQDEAESRCYQLQEEQQLTVIPPFDHLDVIAGQGTIGLELLEDLPTIDCVIGGLSGGGLMSGIGLVMKETNPSINVYGVSMEKGAVMHASLTAGHPVNLPEHHTLADSLLGGLGENNQYTFPLIKKYLDYSALIPESSIAKGMAYLYKHHHIVVEGAAAIGVGAILDDHLTFENKNIVVIISGCNVSLADHAQAIQPYLTTL
ncbi:hydroxyectoine utilization dehydratase EutB [Niallia sp. JL1B1071]|uniref:hydroxyectoine utilization dehydratase EutB n=1 Tax=Niallia tiangongensis TaxID=3237105 RepID=UPI0037DC4934